MTGSCTNECERIVKQVDPKADASYVNKFCETRYVKPNMPCTIACASSKCTKSCLNEQEKRDCLKECDENCERKEGDTVWWKRREVWLGVAVTAAVLLMLYMLASRMSRRYVRKTDVELDMIDPELLRHFAAGAADQALFNRRMLALEQVSRNRKLAAPPRTI